MKKKLGKLFPNPYVDSLTIALAIVDIAIFVVIFRELLF